MAQQSPAEVPWPGKPMEADEPPPSQLPKPGPSPHPSPPLSEGRSPMWDTTSGQVLGHDVDGLLCDYGIETDQPLMLESFHQVSLAQEGLWGHGSLLQGLDGHLHVVFVIT